jgi:hypothetical protein
MRTVLIKALLVTGPRDLRVLKKISWSAVTCVALVGQQESVGGDFGRHYATW